MIISKKTYSRLRDAEKKSRKLRDSIECANAYARYQESQMEWWKKSYYELEKEKDDIILDLEKRIIDLEYELNDVKEISYKAQVKEAQDVL